MAGLAERQPEGATRCSLPCAGCLGPLEYVSVGVRCSSRHERYVYADQCGWDEAAKVLQAECFGRGKGQQSMPWKGADSCHADFVPKGSCRTSIPMALRHCPPLQPVRRACDGLPDRHVGWTHYILQRHFSCICLALPGSGWGECAMSYCMFGCAIVILSALHIYTAVRLCRESCSGDVRVHRQLPRKLQGGRTAFKLP